MTRPRSIPFQKVVVTPARPQDQRPAENAQKLRFSDLLKQRRASAQSAEAEAIADKKDSAEIEQAAEAEEPVFPPVEEVTPHEEKDAAEDLDTEWLESLVPTPETVEQTLEQARLAAAGRAGAVLEALQAIPPAARAIAITVTRFCNERSVDDSEGWQVRMPLNPEVMPDTVMQLAISPYWLQLRFETTDEPSRNILFQHRDALTHLIGESLNRRRDVAISID